MLLRSTQTAVVRSVKLYRRLLFLYPAGHRQTYGPAMVQLFRDQCRDAAAPGNSLGLFKVWVRVLFDLAMTSLQERISTIKGNRFMFKATWVTDRTAFVVRFLAGFLLVLLTTTAITFILPETYSSTARINLEPPNWKVGDDNSSFIQTQVERLLSKQVLYPVIEELNLNQLYARRLGLAGTLKAPETYGVVTKHLTIRQVRNTTLVEVRVSDVDPREAALIANGIVGEYRKSISLPKTINVELVDPAEPNRRPVRPNIPLNLAIGVLLGTIVGIGGALSVKGGRGKSPPLAPTPTVVA